ncbi:hypothetical protein M0R45_037791 [Rubus argutus]|uniref:Uncharacterized protein n=1 Tax=Rubus argutus TaxID=59490 RepID=A0AAW1W3B0_RUBAR
MQHFAMTYAFTEVIVQTSAILAFYINQSIGKVGAKEEGKVQIELRPWQALLKTWEAAKARGDWGSELETQQSLDRIEKLLSNLNTAYTQLQHRIWKTLSI